VHERVPFYADRLAKPVDRFMRHVKPGHIAARLNWSILDNPALFQPTGKWRDAADASITAENAGAMLYLRVERQTLRRLPISDAILFGIRVHNYRLNDVIGDAVTKAALASSVRALPREMLHYKSMLPFRDALLAWLEKGADANLQP
jgi:dimethylamine monooxygenase subunit A